MGAVATLDVRTARENGLAGSPLLCDWLRSLGVDPNGVYEFTVYADGDGQVEVWEYARNADGKRYMDRSINAPAKRPPHFVPLTSPVPAEVMAAGRP